MKLIERLNIVPCHILSPYIWLAYNNLNSFNKLSYFILFKIKKDDFFTKNNWVSLHCCNTTHKNNLLYTFELVGEYKIKNDDLTKEDVELIILDYFDEYLKSNEITNFNFVIDMKSENVEDFGFMINNENQILVEFLIDKNFEHKFNSSFKNMFTSSLNEQKVDAKKQISKLISLSDEHELKRTQQFYKEICNLTENKALRYNEGKLRYSLIDFEVLDEMVKVLEFGAKKYSDNNWKNGMSEESILDSSFRHLTAMTKKEDIDPESGLPHFAHLFCNIMFYGHYYLKRKKQELSIKEDKQNATT